MFLLSNALFSELFLGVTNLFDSFSSKKLDDLLFGVEYTEATKTIEATAVLRQSLRRKATYQNIATAFIAVPVVLGAVFFESSWILEQELLWIILPFFSLALASLLLENWDTIGCLEFVLLEASALVFAHLRIFTLLPRLLGVLWAQNLAYSDLIGQSLDAEVKRVTLELYAIYLLVPLIIRMVSDFCRSREMEESLESDRPFRSRILTATDFTSIGTFAGNI